MQQHGGFVQPGPLEGSKLTLPAQTLAGNDGSYRDQVKGIALGTGLSMSGGVLRAVGSAFDGAVATWADLPVGLVTPVVESVYLVRNGSGVWLLNRKKSGLYQRVALTGDRAADWNYLGEWLEEFSDANFEVWHDDDTTRGLKFSLADQATGTTVTVRSNDLETLGTMAAGWSGVSGHLLRTDNPHAVTAAQVGLGSVDNTRDADKPVSTAQAAAIGARAPLVHGHASEDISDSTYVGRSLLTAASAAAQRNLIGVTPWATNQWTNGTTDDVPEGTQLYFTNARADARADARISAQKGQAGGLATLNAHGELDSTQVPAVSVVDFLGQVASEAAMLALAGEKGDWCTRTDLGTDWQIIGNDPTQAASWRQSMYPASPVQSVHGRNGAVWGQVGDYDMFYLLKTAQAADSAMLGGQLPSYYSVNGHVHSGYESALGNPSIDGYLLASTTTGARSWVVPYSHPPTHAQSVIDSAAGWITEALNGKQAAGNYLTTTGTAADSAKLGGVAAGGYSVAGHTHNYAGSASPGGDASRALYCTNPQFSGDAAYAEDITQRTYSGTYQGNAEVVTTARGWPMNGEWTHLITATHNNTGLYCSMQFAGLYFYQRFFARNTGDIGTQSWVELMHSGNYTSLIGDGSMGIAKINGLSGALSTRAVTAGSADFGGAAGNWTTADFIADLTAKGAFNTSQWSIRGSWVSSGNKTITDTGCGDIDLAGATVEVFSGTQNEYMVRVTTSPSTLTGYYPKTVFIYQNHGASYAPGWRRMLNNDSTASSAQVLAPLSGDSDYRLAYTSDGACIHREAYGRVVMSSSENGETYGVRVGQADMVSDPNFHRLTNPGGATFVSQASQQIGAIAIHLPVGMTNTMVRVVGRVFEFATSSSFDFVICGYSYGVGNTWGNYPTAYIMGNPGADRRFTVRFGYDSLTGKAVLYLGELSTVWSFPQVFITEVQLGYSGMSEQWTYGWNISFESTAFSNVTATISDCQVGYRTPNMTAFDALAGTGVPVRTGTNTWELRPGKTASVVIGGTTLNFVNGLLVSYLST